MKALPVLLALSALNACVDAEEHEREPPQVGVSVAAMRDETIEIDDCKPGWLGNGEVCINPLEGGDGGGGGGGGPGPSGGEGGPGGVPRGGGGGGGADPYPIPAPKDCTKELTHETCMQCCDWNVDKVWGERCRRIPKKNKEERKLCWIEAENRRSECQMPCPRPDPIVTIRGHQ